ncbi:methyltransferase domain-containing protein [Taklimakanibacter deserti]|uniref:methyltransferase domain-containing protein n=1 Tax=Taklimakanibacter deserti TaxID=2267839 RepID=UPI000E646F85
MTSGVPQIFDSALRRLHFARARSTRPPFYAQTLAAEIESRLCLILRDFKTTLICGPAAGEIRDGLAGTQHLGRMVTAAPAPGPGIDVVFEDEAQPLAGASFDCILSLFSLNSVNDVPGALAQFRQALQPDGLFLAALFAGRTLIELREAWLAAEAEFWGGASLRVAPFADMRDLGSLLQRAGFALPAVDIDMTTVRYKDAISLMREIRALGLQHALSERSRRPVTATLLARAASLYDARYADADGRVRATVETAWLIGWAPHESQQQPLRPGSAKARLADALKTEEVKLKRD